MAAVGPLQHMSLGIAEIIVSEKPVVVSTVLGSCISACVYSLKGTVAGINHFALPRNPGNPQSEKEPYRYGDSSMQAMLEALLSLPGVEAYDLRAKIVGGASPNGFSNRDIGVQNALEARKALEAYKVKIAAEDVGGDQGRKIFFFSDSGKIRMSPVESPGSGSLSLSPSRPLVAIGASTGGTQALKQLLLQLPSDIPPILIVQHIPAHFSRSFATRLNELCPFQVKEADHGDRLEPGRVLIAPGDRHMLLSKDGQGYKVKLCDSPAVNRHKPSVDVLFESVAKLAAGHAIGVILTGMGADGAKGLLAMKRSGCLTIAQDEKSCVVFGMPKSAIEMGAASQVADLEIIPNRILQLIARRT